ncbi:ATP-binding protein [Embleya sp. NBC_00896]|uniref:ATP-binding protein n=1 Tax=Embleya sp. NBC_00896 TaxID=2975961 RepID=UPI00386D6A7B|nr:ATP-binding protein [Embleya sp. NBC_00896]
MSTRSVGTARRLAGEFCIRHGFSEQVREVAFLIVSELVTNSVVHVKPQAGAPQECRLILTWQRREFEMAVWDDDPLPCPVIRPADPDVECGRGLAIVLGLAEGFTWMRAAGGKLVAARLRVQSAAEGVGVGGLFGGGFDSRSVVLDRPSEAS